MQHSVNGRDYEAIGNRSAFGINLLGNNYSILDNKAGETNYYRLKIVDKNGDAAFSKIISVNIPGARQKIYVINNPFHDVINLRLLNQPKEKVLLNLYDSHGKLIAAKSYQGVGNSIQLPIPSRAISKGIYLLEAKIDGELYTYRLLKE